MEPCLVAGLGNPGPRYEGTRHNLGFRVVGRLAGLLRVCLRAGHGPWLEAWSAERDLLLLTPLTYMNLSGGAVAAAARQAGVPPHRVLIVLDDLALPIGAMRLRPGGSDGGHNGLASVIAEFGTTEIPRLRCGIGGKEPVMETAAFVLSPFTEEEERELGPVVDRAAEACLLFAERGAAEAMNRFNSRVVPPAGPLTPES